MPDPGPYDDLLAALGDLVPPLVAGIGAVVLLGLGIVAIKWGVPQLIGFFKRIAR